MRPLLLLAILLLPVSVPGQTISSADYYELDGTPRYVGEGPILIEIFATWCKACQEEYQVVQQLHLAFGEELTLITLSGSSEDQIDDIIEFNRTYPANWTLWIDNALSERYHVTSFPTFLFFYEGFAGCTVGAHDMRYMEQEVYVFLHDIDFFRSSKFNSGVCARPYDSSGDILIIGFLTSVYLATSELYGRRKNSSSVQNGHLRAALP